MYPLKFENLYYEKIWGGRGLTLFRENVPEGNIGESWDVACHPHGKSIITNGKYKGIRLDKLIEQHGEDVLGNKILKDWFPLLIKIIDAKDKLSVQVHPDDEYAKQVEGEMGKNEVWYILDALKGATITVGTRNNCTKEKFNKAIEKGELEKYLNKVPVKKGEVYFIKSGLIHAINEGVMLLEIQQNSDTTYRVYDYDRGRQIHINKALDVIDFSLNGIKSNGISVYKEGYIKTYICLCKDFSLELYNVESEFFEESDKERFCVFTCVDGEAEIIYNHGIEDIKKGESVLIPATLGKYSFKGKAKLLKSYVPDIDKVEKEILKEIKK